MSAPVLNFSSEPKTAVIYCRVSTTRQADDELPIQSQRQRCEEKARALGATVLRSYADEGISGQSDSRPAFQQAILYCEAHAPTYLITWSTSRFARNRLDAQLYKRRLSKASVTLIYASMEIDRESQGGWLTEGVMELFDEFASKQIAADTRRSMIKAAQSGYRCGGAAPYGYQAIPAVDDPRRKRLAVLPGEAAVVRRIFEMRAQGIGARGIAITLNEEGQRQRQRLWNKTGILALLRNQSVLGHIVFGRVIRADGERRRTEPENWIVVPAHPPIIDRELWDLVQRMLDSDAANTRTDGAQGSPRSTYLFTGLLRCGRCGASLQIETAKGRSRRYAYYNCRKAQHGGDCVSRRLPARELDHWLFGAICHEVLTPTNLRGVAAELDLVADRWHQDRAERRRQAEIQQRELLRRNRKLYEVLEEMGRDAPNLADIAARLRENNERIRLLKAQMEQIDMEEPPDCAVNETDLRELANCLGDVLMQGYNVHKVRALFSDFMERITIERATVTITYHPEKMVLAIPAVSCHPVPSTRKMLPGAALLGIKTLVFDLPAKMVAV